MKPKKRIIKSKKTTTKKAPPKALTLTPEYIETMKFKAWCRHFFNKDDKDTYGNATKSALRVYNTENYHSAGQIGHENLKKLENLRLTIADGEGFGFAEMMKIGIAKMLKGEFGDWEKMMVRLGYFEPEPQKIEATQNNINFNFNNIQDAISASRKERGLQP